MSETLRLNGVLVPSTDHARLNAIAKILAGEMSSAIPKRQAMEWATREAVRVLRETRANAKNHERFAMPIAATDATGQGDATNRR